MRFTKRAVPDESVVQKLEQAGYSSHLAHLLALRGIKNEEEAKRFLDPNETMFNDPFLFTDMDKAVERIKRALRDNEKIVIYGDYDADGVTAVSILKGFFDSIGHNVDYYIPGRHDEGYGLNDHAVRALAKEHSLMITVDCGIASLEEVDLANELGLDVIVTDHHQLKEKLPNALAVIDPLIGSYPCRSLCGAGVAFKLVHALGGLEAALSFSDLAAIGTVADIVPLMEENRAIVSVGLKRMNENMRPGVSALCSVAGLSGRTIDSGHVGFMLGPRINAGGRIDKSSKSVEMLLSTDHAFASEIALQLEEHNSLRQALERDITARCLELIDEQIDFINDRAIVLYEDGWNQGVVGIVASRMAEKYNMPCILFASDGESLVGSGRSVPGVHILAAISACSSHLTRFGGHEMAAGLSLPVENFEAFRKDFNSYLLNNTADECYLPKAIYDMEITPEEITMELCEDIQKMLPCGMANPTPTFLLRSVRTDNVRKIGSDQRHVKCTISSKGEDVDCVGFSMAEKADTLRIFCDLLVNINKNYWNDKVSVQALLRRIEPAASLFEGMIETRYDEICRDFLSNLVYNEKSKAFLEEPSVYCGIPGRGDMFICSNAKNAPLVLKKLYELYPGLGLERFVKHIGDDKRAYTCVAASPIPCQSFANYRRFIFVDGFIPELAAQIKEFCPEGEFFVTASPMEKLSGLKMDVAQMRTVYCWILKNVSRLSQARDPRCASMLCAQELKLSRAQVYLAMLVFSELGFIKVSFRPWCIKTIASPPKRDLSQSTLFNWLNKNTDI